MARFFHRTGVQFKNVVSVNDIDNILAEWETERSTANFDPITAVNLIADLIHNYYEEYCNQDPDPSDDRQVYKSNSNYGRSIRNVQESSEFVSELFSYLMARNNLDLNLAATRVLSFVAEGLPKGEFFTDDVMLHLYGIALNKEANYSLKALTFDLLAETIDIPSFSVKYKIQNGALVSVCINLLKELRIQMFEEQLREIIEEPSQPKEVAARDQDGPFSNLENESFHDGPRPTLAEVLKSCAEKKEKEKKREREELIRTTSLRIPTSTLLGKRLDANECDLIPRKKMKLLKDDVTNQSTSSLISLAEGLSNSQWSTQQNRMIGEPSKFPVNSVNYQRAVLKFLSFLGENQELLKEAYENRAFELIMQYLKDLDKLETRLLFWILKYLSSLLAHRKCALDFANSEGVETLLKVPKESLASIVVGQCFYYIAYNVDVMARLIMVASEQILEKIVKYQLWLLEHGHESGRAAAALFFSHAFHFHQIVQLFDDFDGSRRLLNYTTTLSFLQQNQVEINEEIRVKSLQIVRNTCATLRSYLAAHLYLKVEHLKKTQSSKLKEISGMDIPASVRGIGSNKPIKMDNDVLEQCIWLLLHCFTAHNTWRAVEGLKQLGVIGTMLNIIEILFMQVYTGNVEILINALEIIWICSTVPRVQYDLCNTKLLESDSHDAFKLLLQICDDEDADPELRKAALNVLINCVCSPVERIGGSRIVFSTISNEVESKIDVDGNASNKIKKPKKIFMNSLELLEKIWLAVRKNHGILVLTKMLRVTRPSTKSDELRALVCRALIGMARSEETRQIFGKMPLIEENELTNLMSEPVIPNKRAEHARFCEQALMFIRTVTEKASVDFTTKDFTQEKFWKSNVVSSTRILFNDKELLQLIHQHLTKNSLHKTAAMLQQEAELPDVPASCVLSQPSALQTLPTISETSFTISQHDASQLDECPLHLDIVESDSLSVIHDSEPTDSEPTCSSSERNLSKPQRHHQTAVVSANQHVHSVTRHRNAASQSHTTPVNSGHNYSAASRLTNRKSVLGRNAIKPVKDLEEIFTDHFRKQHAACKYPVSVCPPFSVFFPHECPEPRHVYSVPNNITSRFLFKPLNMYPACQLHYADMRYAFSRFRTLRLIENNSTFTCCNFSIDDEHVLLGNYDGMLQWYNIHTGVKECETNCHFSPITVVEQSKDGSLLLTSSKYMKPLSSIWRIDETQQHMFNIPDDYFLEFGKTSAERVVGTQKSKAKIYSTETGQLIISLEDKVLPSRYIQNRATFDQSDNLVLNDGLLWDIRSPSQAIHKFDKLNYLISGLFHPHGIDIIINSEVWDMRTYRLSRCVPTLDQCKISFSSSGHYFYAAAQMKTYDDNCPLKSSFRTFDAVNYEVIATVDVKRPLCDLAPDHRDEYVTIIEAHSVDNPIASRGSCRIYEVGKKRDMEEDEQEYVERSSDGSTDDDEDGVSLVSFGASTSTSTIVYSSDDDEDDDESGDESGGNEGDGDEEDDDEDDDNDNDDDNGDNDGGNSGNEDSEDENENADGGSTASSSSSGENLIIIDARVDDFSDGSSDPDEAYEPDEDSNDGNARREGTSSIVLNPKLRRQKRNENNQR